ncbi:oxygen-insensitive NADPH nitroreductase [Paenibacillaceae bacterium WGS1546]|uniref:oxygen-insensitive NADPH nitroreductase n=1 Tax=Cohnella sp. WGS1546 TaxID=3366810 RepID=UPI00372D5E28
MNPTIDLLRRHRSIRRYVDRPLAPEQIEAIIASAQAASTSSNVQAYTVIGVSDAAIRARLAELAGNQAYVERCGLFLVWCADLHRLREASAMNDAPFSPNMESLLVATVDTALAAQNAAIAAESLGLGICYIGGIRNHPQAVSELLQLPELTYPVFGMCVGVPDQESGVRPRFDKEAVYHENAYDAKHTRQHIQAYDAVMRPYYRERSQGKLDANWSQGIADKYRQPVRAHMKSFLEGRGFRLD